MKSQHLHFDFEGHRLTYRISGHGPALVVPHLYRRPADVDQARLLSDRWQVFQIAPVGYGYSDRVPGYAGERLVDQVLAMLDQHSVDRFVYWGNSKGSAMGLCIARATDRIAGLVCGGFAPSPMTPGVVRQLDRRLPPDHASRSLWWWYNNFDWTDELSTMSCARLFYWGSDDRQMATKLREMRSQIPLQDVDFMEFPGLAHASFTPPVMEELVVPAVADWTERHVGPAW
jgi:pimeloyl-ACP methyl ester carboxylesterase